MISIPWMIGPRSRTKLYFQHYNHQPCFCPHYQQQFILRIKPQHLGQRTHISTYILRMPFRLVRWPLGLLGLGTSTAAYAKYTLDSYTPEWLKNASDSTKAWFDAWKSASLPQETSPGDSGLSLHAEEVPPPPGSHPIESFDPNLMNFTKRLIGVRQLLRNVVSQNGDSSTSQLLTLPSIVVIGAQSSGKSSVLEAIVGHEFLPKGSNMVTRRPIELTLVHSPTEVNDYGVFPQLGLGKMTDFRDVQRTLRDLNAAVPDTHCVSSEPIELQIYSPNVPDLSLVDLPGYIQLHALHQPDTLKSDIAQLCESYIQEPNLLLAVSPADVDLANSEALRAARKVDPLGKRTLGVITKLDLVPPQVGVNLLTTKDYPLELGYVGIIAKAPSHHGASASHEQKYFATHTEYKDVPVGTRTLCLRLMNVLDSGMRSSLSSVVASAKAELQDAKYAFKVQCNDRHLTVDSYIAELTDDLKRRLQTFSDSFKKPFIRSVLQALLMSEAFKICDDTFWRGGEAMDGDGVPAVIRQPCVPGEPRASELQAASSRFTRLGIGRLTVDRVTEMLNQSIQDICSSSNGSPLWKAHSSKVDELLKLNAEIIQSHAANAANQVENAIKPYKYEMEIEEREWKQGLSVAIQGIEEELAEAQKALKRVKVATGARRSRLFRRSGAMPVSTPQPSKHSSSTYFVSSSGGIVSEQQQERVDWSEEVDDMTTHDPKIQVRMLNQRVSMLSARLSALKSRQCFNLKQAECCPEVYLSVVASKLASTAVLFIQVELLNDYFDALPRLIDARMYLELSADERRAFAEENTRIAQHLRVQERKEVLEEVVNRLEDIRRSR